MLLHLTSDRALEQEQEDNELNLKLCILSCYKSCWFFGPGPEHNKGHGTIVFFGCSLLSELLEILLLVQNAAVRITELEQTALKD